jgi:hypothetical protein
LTRWSVQEQGKHKITLKRVLTSSLKQGKYKISKEDTG